MRARRDRAAVMAAGLLVWSLTEYLVHRFVFHLAGASPAGRRLQFIVHGVHHEAPTTLLDPEALRRGAWPVETVSNCAPGRGGAVVRDDGQT